MSNIINYLIIISLALYSCANPQPPSGGPPDKTAPFILESSVKNESLNFNEKKVSFTFNKYMNKSLVNENITILPDIPFNYDWSGKELEIDFLQDLDTNTTYMILFGTDYTDIKGNKPEQAFTYIFSTGQNIDTGKIDGMLNDSKPEGSYIFVYRLAVGQSDTFNILNRKPDYRIQVGTSGRFNIPALKDGNYRLIAVRDKFKDGMYDRGVDDFGASPFDINVKTIGESSKFINLKISNPIDMIPPVLNNVEAISGKVLIAKFTESPDSNYLSPDSFILSDSLGKKTIEILSAYPSIKSSSDIILITGEKLDSTVIWKLKASSDSLTGIRDSLKNFIPDSSSKSYFFASTDKDTLKPGIASISIRDSAKDTDIDSRIYIIFKMPVDFTDIDKRILLFNTTLKKSEPFTIKKLTEIRLEIKPDKPLANDNNYELSAGFSCPDILNNKVILDTLIKIRFKTADTRSYGGMEGKLVTPQNDSNYVIEIYSATTNKSLRTKADSGLNFSFNSVPPGDYKMIVFRDIDNNGKFDYGNDYPFKHSELFYVIPTEFTVKPRWKSSDLIINLK